jgi:O-acetyl-ADP-ribose deacetylase (regulator of RNase III)
MIPGLMRNLKISAEGTEREVIVERAHMAPRGAAVLTGAGRLEREGISHIIHAATGSMTRMGGPFEPSLEAIALAVKNSLILAADSGHERVAVPFLGGAIFANRIGAEPAEIAQTIVDAALPFDTELEVSFVVLGAGNRALFEEALAKHPGLHASVKEGSITDRKVHGCAAIVNAANMELVFGGGLSGAIGAACGMAREIESEARMILREYYEN